MSTVIVGAARTPIGRFGGGLSPLRAVDLGGHALAAAMDRSGVDPGAIDEPEDLDAMTEDERGAA